MISSTLLVPWTRLVRACRRCWNVSFWARLSSPAAALGSTLIMASSAPVAVDRTVHGRGTFGSKLENVVVLQHLGTALRHAHADLFHDLVGFTRLQMRYVD